MFFEFLVLIAITKCSFAQIESYFEKKHPDLKAFETAGFVHFGDFSEYTGLKFEQQVIKNLVWENQENGFQTQKTFYNKSVWFSNNKMHNHDCARDHCRVFGLDFMTIDSEAELNWFVDRFHQNLTWFNTPMHLGANRVETDWVWSANAQPFTFHPPWAPGQPDGQQKDEKCAVFKQNVDEPYLLHDYVCSMQFKYFCASTSVQRSFSFNIQS
jgi:hypothetical protein